MTSSSLLFLLLVISIFISISYSYRYIPSSSLRYKSTHSTKLNAIYENNGNDAKVIMVPLGDGYKDIEYKLKPLFTKSQFIVLEYQVPFDLGVDKPTKEFPWPVVKKEGKGGEVVGDVLRATTCWSQGFNAAGATSDIMAFAGTVKWRKGVFDTTGSSWQNTG